MSQLGQALRVARQRMASGLTGGELRESLRDVFSQLDPVAVTKLAKRIAKEEFFLGQAAHDPNLYKNCHEARQAKKVSANQNLMVLTYKTSLCASCGYNRKGNCGLMGGKLINSAEDAPEIAVQRTGDIMAAEGEMPVGYATKVASRNDVSPLIRLQTMHKKRLGGFQKDTSSTDIPAQIKARRVAAILDPAENNAVKGKNLRAPSARKASNSEDFEIEAPELTANRTASRQVSIFENMMQSPDITVRSRPAPGRQTSRQAEIDPYGSSMTLAHEDKQASQDVDEDHEEQAQAALHSLSLKSSRLLAQGKMTATLATKLAERIQTMEDFGARHSTRTARVKTQLLALSGGLEY